MMKYCVHRTSKSHALNICRIIDDAAVSLNGRLTYDLKYIEHLPDVYQLIVADIDDIVDLPKRCISATYFLQPEYLTIVCTISSIHSYKIMIDESGIICHIVGFGAPHGPIKLADYSKTNLEELIDGVLRTVD